MANFRQVHSKIWDDEWFCQLDSDGKILFVYLVTNHRASIAGIYQIPMRSITFETGLPESRIQKLLHQFGKDGKAFYEDGIMWVAKLRYYQYSGSPLLLKHIIHDVTALPDCPLKIRYQYAHIGDEYPIDTLSIPYPDNSIGYAYPSIGIVSSSIESSSSSNTITEDGNGSGKGLGNGCAKGSQSPNDLSLNIPGDDTGSKPEKVNLYPQDYKRFLSLYPKVVNPAQTERNWKALMRKGVDPSLVLRAAEHYAAKVTAEATESQYMILSTNFLGKMGRYTEFIDAPAAQPAAAAAYVQPQLTGNVPPLYIPDFDENGNIIR